MRGTAVHSLLEYAPKMPPKTPHPLTPSPLPSPHGRGKRGRGVEVRGHFHASGCPSTEGPVIVPPRATLSLKGGGQCFHNAAGPQPKRTSPCALCLKSFNTEITEGFSDLCVWLSPGHRGHSAACWPHPKFQIQDSRENLCRLRRNSEIVVRRRKIFAEQQRP